MKQVPPLLGEEALYSWIGSVLEASAMDPKIKATLRGTAAAAEEMITSFLEWRYNGRPAGNSWNSGEQCRMGHGLPQSHRDREVEHVRQPARGNEIYLTEDDSDGGALDGWNACTITLAKARPLSSRASGRNPRPIRNRPPRLPGRPRRRSPTRFVAANP
jgi:hypothetical protein